MKVTKLDLNPVRTLTYRNAVPASGGTRTQLPLLLGEVEGFADARKSGLDALLVTSDLQGRTKDDRLLGEQVPEWLHSASQAGVIPPLEHIGACLCGDMYAKPGGLKLGGLGDVRPVWSAFARRFRWVLGVAGNHDAFGATSQDSQRFARAEGAGFLDGGLAERDGLLVGGLSGLIGDPTRPFRRLEQDYLDAFDRLLQREPDLLLMHDGPDFPETGDYGIPTVRERLERFPRPLLVCRGHSRWKRALVDLTPSCQVLNADGRLILLLLT